MKYNKMSSFDETRTLEAICLSIAIAGVLSIIGYGVYVNFFRECKPIYGSPTIEQYNKCSIKFQQ